VTAALELQGITAGYGDSHVLRDVSVTVPPSSVVAMLGANGAGKTTLLKVASGLLAPAAGRVLVDGVDVTGAAPHELVDAGVCHVPEGRGIFRSLTVSETLQLFSKHRPDGYEEVLDAFPRLGQRLHQLGGTMSGGEQQMLALSRAYLSSAHVVLLDEVSMGLAPKVVDEIFEFISALAKQGRALLLVEQFVSRALAVADYVCVLHKGQLSFTGEPRELASGDVADVYLGVTG
jgi:branched-chain amino acid transport system ATP-binding protein